MLHLSRTQQGKEKIEAQKDTMRLYKKQKIDKGEHSSRPELNLPVPGSATERSELVDKIIHHLLEHMFAYFIKKLIQLFKHSSIFKTDGVVKRNSLCQFHTKQLPFACTPMGYHRLMR